MHISKIFQNIGVDSTEVTLAQIQTAITSSFMRYTHSPNTHAPADTYNFASLYTLPLTSHFTGGNQKRQTKEESPCERFAEEPKKSTCKECMSCPTKANKNQKRALASCNKRRVHAVSHIPTDLTNINFFVASFGFLSRNSNSIDFFPCQFCHVFH